MDETLNGILKEMKEMLEDLNRRVQALEEKKE